MGLTRNSNGSVVCSDGKLVPCSCNPACKTIGIYTIGTAQCYTLFTFVQGAFTYDSCGCDGNLCGTMYTLSAAPDRGEFIRGYSAQIVVTATGRFCCQMAYSVSFVYPPVLYDGAGILVNGSLATMESGLNYIPNADLLTDQFFSATLGDAIQTCLVTVSGGVGAPVAGTESGSTDHTRFPCGGGFGMMTSYFTDSYTQGNPTPYSPNCPVASCVTNISPTVFYVGQSGTGVVDFTLAHDGPPLVVNVTADVGCEWSGYNDFSASFIFIYSQTLSGSGTVEFGTGANNNPNPFFMAFWVNGTRINIYQSGTTGCVLSLSTTTQIDTTGQGFSGNINNVIVNDGCPWSVTVLDAWITVTGGSGTGSGPFTFSAAANPTGISRIGHIQVAGPSNSVTLEVQQGPNALAIDCAHATRPTSVLLPTFASAPTVKVSPGVYDVASASTDPTFVKVAPQSGGTGSCFWPSPSDGSAHSWDGFVATNGQVYFGTLPDGVTPAWVFYGQFQTASGSGDYFAFKVVGISPLGIYTVDDASLSPGSAVIS